MLSLKSWHICQFRIADNTPSFLPPSSTIVCLLCLQNRPFVSSHKGNAYARLVGAGVLWAILTWRTEGGVGICLVPGCSLPPPPALMQRSWCVGKDALIFVQQLFLATWSGVSLCIFYSKCLHPHLFRTTPPSWCQIWIIPKTECNVAKTGQRVTIKSAERFPHRTRFSFHVSKNNTTNKQAIIWCYPILTVPWSVVAPPYCFALAFFILSMLVFMATLWSTIGLG